MRRAVTYRLESNDPRELSPDRIGEIEHLLREFISDEDRGLVPKAGPSPKEGKSQPARGLKVMGLIKGGMPFEASDVTALGDFVEVLCDRLTSRIDKLTAERDAEPRDERSLAAYDFLISSMTDTAATARKLCSDFVDIFEQSSNDLEADRLHRDPAEPDDDETYPVMRA